MQTDFVRTGLKGLGRMCGCSLVEEDMPKVNKVGHSVQFCTTATRVILAAQMQQELACLNGHGRLPCMTGLQKATVW